MMLNEKGEVVCENCGAINPPVGHTCPVLPEVQIPELDEEDDDPSPHCSQCPNDPCDCKIADND
jgi:hypothetical protein